MRNESFTVKEIAEMTGVTARDVKSWVIKIADHKPIGELGVVTMRCDAYKKIEIESNCSGRLLSERFPARFTPLEALMIIEAGLRKDYPLIEYEKRQTSAETAEYFEKLERKKCEDLMRENRARYGDRGSDPRAVI
jgi:hypothetical protein